MTCCKKRKEKVKKLMERRIFELESYRIIKNLKGKIPTSLPNQLLLDYHRKTHMLYAAALKHNPPNKKFINEVVLMHNEYVKEMKKREIKHTTPMERI